jgi:hypothetical protein
VKHLKDQHERNGRTTRGLAGVVVSREESHFSAELFMHEHRQSHGVKASLGLTRDVHGHESTFLWGKDRELRSDDIC